VRFTADVARIPHARRWVVRQASGAGASAEALRIVALLASEVVTNAVQHGPAGGEVCVRVERRADHVRVAVHDADPRPPVRRTPPSSSMRGRGVQLVDLLAASWGVDADDAGKTVWFEVPLAPGAS
jgi:anti-sigma regulatory factor (Ser/Thr protein kinase)